MEEQSQDPKETSTPEEAKPETQAKPNQDAKQIEPPTPSYVKRKKRRAALWTLVGITGAGVLTLGIIAFLGQNFGNFTVKLNNDEDASLQMGEILSINSRGTDLQTPSTYLNVGGMTSTSCITADDLPSASILDSDITTDNYDDVMYAKKVAKAAVGEQTSEDEGTGVYFNYTFYVRNISSEAVTYSIKYYCTKNIAPDNLYNESGEVQSVSLEKFVRIRVYENTYSSASAALPTHNQTTYAYPRTTEGTALPEFVGDKNSKNPESSALCTNFSDWQSDLFTVFDKQDISLPGNTIVRYSIVMWFEGYDSDVTTDVVTPSNGSLAFAIDITGKKSRSSESVDASASI